MNSLRFPTVFLVLLWNLVPALLSASDGATYTNPILTQGGADPAVLYHDGTYYMYTTNGKGVVFTSTDLVNWREGGKVIPDHLRGAWAPEVYYHPEDGKFYLYYTYRYKIGVAVADRPDALFKDLGFIVIPSIDAHPFRDDDGQLYLYFVQTPDSSIYCMPMYSPTEPGGPATLCFAISQEWEKHDHPINEGPYMVKQDGTYYLFYSGSNGQTVYYSVGYATAPTPMGPFTKFTGNPVIAHTDTALGPGHGSFTMDRAGQWWHLYHQKTDTQKGWARFICIDPLEMDRDRGELWSLPTKGVHRPAPNMNPERVWCPEISPRGAFFYQSETVTVASRTPDSVIHYTLDGTEPTEGSPVYEAPVEITEDTLFQARAFKKDRIPSSIARMRFVRTNWKLPEMSLTDAPSGNPPFRVWPSPVPVAPTPR